MKQVLLSVLLGAALCSRAYYIPTPDEIAPRSESRIDEIAALLPERPGERLPSLAEGCSALPRYRDDIKKYAECMDRTRIRNVYDHVPAQLAKENKKFQISKIAPGARFRDYRGCVEWLEDAGVVKACYCLGLPELPLKGNYRDDVFKLYLSDTGLLVSMLDDAAQHDLRANQNFGMYKGALYENIVAEAFAKAGLDLFYWKKENATLEQDFFVCTAKRLVPVEVKGERGVGRSMRTLISSDTYRDVSWGIKLHAGNAGCENRVLTLPYWCAFLLPRLLSDEEALSQLGLDYVS